MPTNLSIVVDDKAWRKTLQTVPEDVRKKVIPNAINRTTDEALRQVRADLPKTFTIRTTWVSKGFRTTKATASKHEARLFHKDPYMARQAEGGTKDPKDGGHVAVPIMGLQRGQTRTQVTRPRDWPAKLKNAYDVTLRDGSVLIFQRPGRKGRRPKGTRRGTARAPMPSRLMYVLRPSVKVPARWHFLEQVRAVVQDRWATNVEGYLTLALAGRLK